MLSCKLKLIVKPNNSILRFFIFLLFSVLSKLTFAQKVNLQFGAGFGKFSFAKISANQLKENLEILSLQLEPCIALVLNVDIEIPRSHIFRTGLAINTFGASQVWNQKAFANVGSDTLYFRSNYSNYRLNYLSIPIIFENEKTHFIYGISLIKVLGIKHNSFTDETAVLNEQKIAEKTVFSGFEGNSNFLPFLRSLNVHFLLGYSYPFRDFLHINFQLTQSVLPVFKGSEIPWANFRSSELKASLMFYLN